MKKVILMIGTAAVYSLLSTGCATILTGKTQKINLTSSKPQTVVIDGEEYKAPGIVTLEKDDKDKVLTVKECNKKVLLKKGIEPSFWVNIFIGGVFGSTTDYASKSMWKYEPDNVDVECK